MISSHPPLNVVRSRCTLHDLFPSAPECRPNTFKVHTVISSHPPLNVGLTRSRCTLSCDLFPSQAMPTSQVRIHHEPSVLSPEPCFRPIVKTLLSEKKIDYLVTFYFVFVSLSHAIRYYTIGSIQRKSWEGANLGGRGRYNLRVWVLNTP